MKIQCIEKIGYSNFIDKEAYLFELVIISGNLNMSKVPGPQVTMCMDLGPLTL